MILPYMLRLLCLCFASFFVLNFAACLLIRIASKSALRFAESNAARTAARLLIALRILPFALATLGVLGLCVPSYFWLEPASTSERVGIVSIVLALLGVASCSVSIVRTARALFASLRHNRLCRSSGRESYLPGEPSPVVLVETEAPLLALSGLFRPRLVISRGVLRALSFEELHAALRHEHAHRSSRDNAKRLLLLLAPDIFPFVRPLRALERNWSKFAEWTADDQAVSGDLSRAVSLAAALVQVARMGTAPRLPYLSTSLLASDGDLSDRVDRLLETAPILHAPTHLARQAQLRIAAFLFAACLAAVLLTPSTLSAVHKVLELLLH